jgi:hypothetical protein
VNTFLDFYAWHGDHYPYLPAEQIAEVPFSCNLYTSFCTGYPQKYLQVHPTCSALRLLYQSTTVGIMGQ